MPWRCQYDNRAVLPFDQAAQFVFGAPRRSVVVLGGIDAALRKLVDQAEHTPNDCRALFVPLQPGPKRRSLCRGRDITLSTGGATVMAGLV
jgi:hypothetical protein